MLSERKQHKWPYIIWLHLHRNTQNKQISRDRSRELPGAGDAGWFGGDLGVTVNGHRVSLQDGENVLKLIVVKAVQPWIHYKPFELYTLVGKLCGVSIVSQ